MNDYLANLSARSFDRMEGIPLVSPRLPSLFEPSQELWGISIEVPSRPLVNHPPNDETPLPPLEKVGEDLTMPRQSPERNIKQDTIAPKSSAVVSHFYRDPMEILTKNAERPSGDYGAAVAALPRQDLHALKIRETSETPFDKRSLEPHVRNHTQEEPATRNRAATGAEPLAPIIGGKDWPLSAQERPEGSSAQPRSKSQKERLIVENVKLNEHIERIMDRNVSSGADRGERHSPIKPLTMQPPPQLLIEPIFNKWKNPDHREAPAKTEPTIQVTIGRIEVHATPAPVQNRPEPKAPESMSLDEYLRQRDGGGR